MMAFLLAVWIVQDADPLLEGRYASIARGPSAREKSAWAFARYHLQASKEMAEAAKEAHEAGDPLGTLVLVLCHRNGLALKRNEKEMWRLNHALLKALEKKKEPAPFEVYMLSHAMVADENGVLSLESPEGKALELEGHEEGRRRKLLLRAAEGGCAQAMNDLGRGRQDAGEHGEAYAWYQKAAKKGLAEGMRNQGYLLMTGQGAEANRAEAYRISVEAADRGDVFAMVNVAIYHEKGWGVKADPAEARAWIAKAAATGHWAGAMEMAGGLLAGHYGFEKNAAKGKEWMAKAIETRQSDVLYRVASFYAKSFILDKNDRKAVAFAEAAFAQGERNAAGLLAHLYKEGSAEVPKNDALHTYWFAQSNASMAYAVRIDETHPELTRRLEALDPWKVVIE